MVKLVPAKCPSCGADIEVNKNLEKTMCNYCGTTVLVEDAISKVKVELSGEVSVDGIKGKKTLITQAKKHFRLEEYDAAMDKFSAALKIDEFDIDAYKGLVQSEYKLLENVTKNNPGYQFLSKKQFLVDNFLADYRRLKKIDEDKEAEDVLYECKDMVDYCNKAIDDKKKADEEYDKKQAELRAEAARQKELFRVEQERKQSCIRRILAIESILNASHKNFNWLVKSINKKVLGQRVVNPYESTLSSYTSDQLIKINSYIYNKTKGFIITMIILNIIKVVVFAPLFIGSIVVNIQMFGAGYIFYGIVWLVLFNWWLVLIFATLAFQGLGSLRDNFKSLKELNKFKN